VLTVHRSRVALRAGGYGNPFHPWSFVTRTAARAAAPRACARLVRQPHRLRHVLYNYTDNSAVETLITFPTNFGDEEAPFLTSLSEMAIPAGTGLSTARIRLIHLAAGSRPHRGYIGHNGRKQLRRLPRDGIPRSGRVRTEGFTSRNAMTLVTDSSTAP